MWATGLYRRGGKLREKSVYLSDIAPIDSKYYIIIARVSSYKANNDTKQKDYREYRAFGTYPELFRFIESTEEAKRVYHELILENSRQKPRFDIDIDKTQPQVNTTKEPGVYKIKRDNSVYGKINGGGTEIFMKTYNGNVYVKKAGSKS